MSFDRTRSRSDRKRTVSENQQLRRENARLRKQLQRLNAAVNTMTFQGFADEEPKEQPETQPLENINPCPKCGKPTGEVELGRYKYLFCSGCSYRERK